jgi:TRAP-type C4-dicarboxylate transport system substrate-binding protein
MYWIEEVERRSGGSLRIQVQNQWRDQEVAYDKETIADVQAGKVQLVKVAARAYDTVVITSFQALLALLLIDNQALERRVLESELAGRMLAAPASLAWWGWRCSQPICASRWACRIRWWRSRTTGVPGSASGRASWPR